MGGHHCPVGDCGRCRAVVRGVAGLRHQGLLQVLHDGPRVWLHRRVALSETHSPGPGPDDTHVGHGLRQAGCSPHGAGLLASIGLAGVVVLAGGQLLVQKKLNVVKDLRPKTGKGAKAIAASAGAKGPTTWPWRRRWQPRPRSLRLPIPGWLPHGCCRSIATLLCSSSTRCP